MAKDDLGKKLVAVLLRGQSVDGEPGGQRPRGEVLNEAVRDAPGQLEGVVKVDAVLGQGDVGHVDVERVVARHCEDGGEKLGGRRRGREREFAAILDAWSAARAGPARFVHVLGAAGLGKTRLLTDVHARLRATGARSIFVRANPGDRGVAYAFAADIAAKEPERPAPATITS